MGWTSKFQKHYILLLGRVGFGRNMCICLVEIGKSIYIVWVGKNRKNYIVLLWLERIGNTNYILLFGWVGIGIFIVEIGKSLCIDLIKKNKKNYIVFSGSVGICSLLFGLAGRGKITLHSRFGSGKDRKHYIESSGWV